MENIGFLLELTPMATISRSHRPTACPTTSRWPLVTGSNEPGYSAMRGINPSTPPRAVPQAGRVPCRPGKSRLFLFGPVLNHLPGPRVFHAPAVFHPE